MTSPNGDPVWVSVASPLPGDLSADGRGAQDVALGDSVAVLIQTGQLPGFTETVRGVMTSVRDALDTHRPDVLTVEFGIEINIRTGKVLSVLAEGGGTAHVKVAATWQETAARQVASGVQGG